MAGEMKILEKMFTRGMSHCVTQERAAANEVAQRASEGMRACGTHPYNAAVPVSAVRRSTRKHGRQKSLNKAEGRRGEGIKE